MADHKLTGLNGCGDKAEQIFIKKTTPASLAWVVFFGKSADYDSEIRNEPLLLAMETIVNQFAMPITHDTQQVRIGIIIPVAQIIF